MEQINKRDAATSDGGTRSDGAPDVRRTPDDELVKTGVDAPDIHEVANDEVDPLTRQEIEDDPGEATRKLPKNDQAL
jgi:hypothetical protein